MFWQMQVELSQLVASKSIKVDFWFNTTTFKLSFVSCHMWKYRCSTAAGEFYCYSNIQNKRRGTAISLMLSIRAPICSIFGQKCPNFPAKIFQHFTANFV